MEVIGFWIKKKQQKMISKIFSSKTTHLKKVSKNTVSNTLMQICDEIYLTKATNRNISI